MKIKIYIPVTLVNDEIITITFDAEIPDESKVSLGQTGVKRIDEPRFEIIENNYADSGIHQLLNAQFMDSADYDQSLLNEHGKYVVRFARNHGISISEANKHPMVQAHQAFCDGRLTERDFDRENWIKPATD